MQPSEAFGMMKTPPWRVDLPIDVQSPDRRWKNANGMEIKIV
jgi:hypothetical protein